MIVVRYVALGFVTLLVSAIGLIPVYILVAAWLAISTGQQLPQAVFIAVMAGPIVLPGLVLFGLVAPVLVVKDVGRGWWHLVAPLCFGAGSIFWYVLAVASPFISDDPKAGVISVAFFHYSLPSVLAGVVGGSLAAAWIERLDWFGP